MFRLDPAALAKAAALPDLSVFDGASVLVTGASGLVGSAFAELLLTRAAAGARVGIFLAGRSEPPLRARFAGCAAPWTFVSFDALAPWRCDRRFDFVLHAAAPAHPAAIMERPADTLRAIVSGTSSVLAHAAATGARRVLFVSSSEIYGVLPGKETPWREDESGFVDPLSPRSCYSQGKRAAETLCAAAAEQDGTDVVIARPGHVYGPTATASDSRAHAEFARAAASGRSIVLRSPGLQLRSYCHALDCATAFAALFARGEKGRACNVPGPAEPVTIRRMAEAFAAAGGVEVVREEIAGGDSRPSNPMPVSALDSARLAALGWRPVYDMDRGAADTVARLRALSANAF